MNLKHLCHKIKHNLIFIGLTSLIWFIFRSGVNPRRIIYPCQQAAFTSSSIFLGSIIGSLPLIKKFRQDKVYRTKCLLKLLAVLILVSSSTLAYNRYTQYIRFKRNELIRQSYSPAAVEGKVKGVFTQQFPYPARVVSVRDVDATTWPGSSSVWQSDWGYYGGYVDQNVIDQMVETGLKQLTKTASLLAAWQVLIPDFQPGQTIAIKVNQNNAFYGAYENDYNQIDALAHPANALIRGLKALGFQESDIWIYEAKTIHPNRFTNQIISIYPNIRFIDAFGGYYSGYGGGYSNVEITRETFSSHDSSLNIQFDHPDSLSLPDHQLADLLLEADYLINLSILKGHRGGAGITLSFKNHYGSIDRGPSDLHDYTYLNRDAYRPYYSPLVDIWQNPQINNKTVLILGDALFASWPSNANPPRRWQSFNHDSPNMIFLSVDPVAIDSVMLDYFAEEGQRHGTPLEQGSDDYLYTAAQAGLGVFDHWDNFVNKDYEQIDYVQLNLDQLRPMISLTKTSDKQDTYPGDQITYTIHYQNTGQAEAVNVIITDPIPTGTSYVSGSANPPASPNGGALSWSFGSLNAGEQGNVEFGVKVE